MAVLGRTRRWPKPSALPGFGQSLGFAAAYLGILVLVPLAGLALKPLTLGIDGIWATIADPRVLAALRLSFGAALAAAAVNVLFGSVVAWVLVRYDLRGTRILDALIDLPFALPTAVAGIALAALFAPNGWIGRWLDPLGIQIAFTPIGVLIALTFIGLPFVVRTLQPVLEDMEVEVEEAAATLGAKRGQVLRRVVLPALWPAILAGFGLAFARAVGEYGSVIFIAGNLPMISEIAPLLIVIKLEQFDYAGAAAVGVAMLALSFLILLLVNLAQRRSRAWAEG